MGLPTWLAFVSPALLAYLAITVVPMLSSVYLAFTDWDGGSSLRFIGAANFKEMADDSMVIQPMLNTLFYALAITILQNVLGLIFAVGTESGITGGKALQTIFFLPSLLSSLLVGYIWGYILEPTMGTVNTLLSSVGLGGWARGWLSEPALARWMIVLVTVWQFAGYSMIIYIAGLRSVPAELYEAAAIEGASPVAKFRTITFPMIAPSFTINIVLCTIGDLKMFDVVYALTGGGPGYATESIATIIYRLGFGPMSRWGYGTALTLVLFVAILILTIVQVKFLGQREVEA